jgi:hypothetical protein
MSRPRRWTTNLRSLGRGASPEVRDVLGFAEDRGGWSGRRTKKGHIQLRHVSGGQVSLPTTSSDHRMGENARSQIRRGEQP